MIKDPDYISGREFGRRMGISPTRVRQLVEAGRIQRGPGKKIHWPTAQAAMARSHGPNNDAEVEEAAPVEMPTPDTVEAAREVLQGKDGKVVSLTKARIAKTIVETNLAQLKLEEEQGRLVPKDQVADFCFRWFRQERDAWQAWPARVAGMMAAELSAGLPEGTEVDQRALLILLEQHIHEHLNELVAVEPPSF